VNILESVLPWVGAGALACMAYVLGNQLVNRAGRASLRVEEMAVLGRKVSEVPFGSDVHRLRLAFQRYGLNVEGKERMALQTARLLAGVLVFIGMYLFLGFPLVTSLVGILGGVLAVNGLVSAAWSRTRQEIEKDVPQFISGLSSTIQVTQAVLPAVEEEARTLAPNSPLRAWLMTRFLPAGQSLGQTALPELTREAFALSSALGISVFLIGRMWQTGGQEWEKAFEMAIQNLEGVLDARVLGQASGASAKGSVQLIAAITVFIIILMVRNPTLSQTVALPLVQVAYAAIVLLMIFGWGMINRMIDEVF